MGTHNSASSVTGEKSSPSSDRLTNPLVLDCKIQNGPGEDLMKEGRGLGGLRCYTTRPSGGCLNTGLNKDSTITQVTTTQ